MIEEKLGFLWCINCFEQMCGLRDMNVLLHGALITSRYS